MTFDEVKNNRYDGTIITGAPVEKIDFEQVEELLPQRRPKQLLDQKMFEQPLVLSSAGVLTHTCCMRTG